MPSSKDKKYLLSKINSLLEKTKDCKTTEDIIRDWDKIAELMTFSQEFSSKYIDQKSPGKFSELEKIILSLKGSNTVKKLIVRYLLANILKPPKSVHAN